MQCHIMQLLNPPLAEGLPIYNKKWILRSNFGGPFLGNHAQPSKLKEKLYIEFTEEDGLIQEPLRMTFFKARNACRC